MKTIMIIIMFFLVGAFFIVSENNLALNDQAKFNQFVGLYSSWLSQIFGNIGGVSGYVVKMDWLPGNSSS